MTGVRNAVQLTLFLLLILGARCVSWNQVFVAGGVYFVDGDCYSRMTRVREVMEHPGRVIRHHDFENFPDGTTPHTTALLDYLIASIALLLRPLSGQPVDLAGALVSPLLAAAAGGFLWFWAAGAKYRSLTLLLFALSPILVQGTALGRPDHQSLLIALLAVALGTEWRLAGNEGSRRWEIAGSTAWGLALWVSLYEPLILLGAVLLIRLACEGPRRWASRERLTGLAITAAIFGFSVLIEGWRASIPGATDGGLFARWKDTIGELTSVSPLSPVVFGWTGWGLVAAPVLLTLAVRSDRKKLPMSLIVVLLYGLTLWQLRWGYFFVLAYAMSLPAQTEPFRRRWVWPAFVLLLWPLWQEWDRTLYPPPDREAELREARLDNVMLRDVAAWLEQRDQGAVMAPWWQSPALAYWSGRPAVAGSSHESLPGIAAASRFFLSVDPETAEGILRERKVKWVVAYDAGRVENTAATLLGQEPPSGRTIAAVLYTTPHRAPPFLQLEYANPCFRVFAVREPQ